MRTLDAVGFRIAPGLVLLVAALAGCGGNVQNVGVVVTRDGDAATREQSDARVVHGGREGGTDASSEAADGTHDASIDDAEAPRDSGLYDAGCAFEGGSCVDADAPFTLGDDTTEGAPYDLVDGALVAQPILVTERVYLTHIGIVTTPDSHGSDASLALYGDKDNQPGALLNRATAFALTTGLNRVGVVSLQSSETELTAGTRYWIVLKISATAAEKPSLYVTKASDAGPVRYGSQAWNAPSSPLPPDVTTLGTGQVSLFIQVQRHAP